MDSVAQEKSRVVSNQYRTDWCKEVEFKGKVELLLDNCKKRGVIMTPYCKYRDPLIQAELWVRSRSQEAIDAKILKLRVQGYYMIADMLAGVIVPAKKQTWLTNALPGRSWHQYNQAVDCYWNVDGTAIWSSTEEIAGVNGYVVYREEALKLGLYIATKKDWPHVQLTKGSPTLKQAEYLLENITVV